VASALAVAVLPGVALADQVAGPSASTVVTTDAAASRPVAARHAPDRAAVQHRPSPATSAATEVTAAPGTVAAASPGDRAAGRQRRGDHGRAVAQPDPTVNPNCTLVVPGDPLSAGGLATPYQLVATDRDAGPCHEANADQSAFVEAAIFDPATHGLSIYHPLVVDRGDRPAVAPVPVTLPAGATVGIWFGFNGDTLTLSGDGATACVNGLPGSPFGQFAYCNAPALFGAANADPAFMRSIPRLGTSPKDALPCPTSRDFSVVDQDQSDNLATVYRVVDGRMAQLTPTTADSGTPLSNGSDEGLVARFIAPALGCQPFTAPDLTNGGTPTPALALNELFAAARQGGPAALVPTSDPMVLVDGAPSVRKTNLYRAGVGQTPLPAGQSPAAYCAHLRALAPARLTTDATFLAEVAAPTRDARNLLAFLKNRLSTTLQELGCQTADAGTAVDGTAMPVTTSEAQRGAAASTVPPPTASTPRTAGSTASTSPPDQASRPSATTRRHSSYPRRSTVGPVTGTTTTDPAVAATTGRSG
jgi:hypothetical protein